MALQATLPHAYASLRRSAGMLLAAGILSLGTLATLATTTTFARPAEDPPPFRGPDVTLIETEERTIQEFRQNGVLVFVKITPKNGKPYYLAPRDPTKGWDDLERAEALVPRWVILRF